MNVLICTLFNLSLVNRNAELNTLNITHRWILVKWASDHFWEVSRLHNKTWKIIDKLVIFVRFGEHFRRPQGHWSNIQDQTFYENTWYWNFWELHVWKPVFPGVCSHRKHVLAFTDIQSVLYCKQKKHFKIKRHDFFFLLTIKKHFFSRIY